MRRAIACAVLLFTLGLAAPVHAEPQIGHAVICFKLHHKPYCLVLR